jgi:hypothetical protein
MTEREYLVSLGLAKPSRGRYSREAIAALEKAKGEGMTFDLPAHKQVTTTKDVPVKKPTKTKGAPEDRTPVTESYRFPLPARVTKRDETTGFALMDIGTRSVVVEIRTCGQCLDEVKFCACPKGPRVPSWITPDYPPMSLERLENASL